MKRIPFTAPLFFVLLGAHWSVMAQARGPQMSQNDCDARKQAIIAMNIPDNAPLTTAYQMVMWAAYQEVLMIDGACPTEPGITKEQLVEQRALRVKQYLSAEESCNRIQAGGNTCRPQQSAAVAAVSALPPSIPQGHTATSPNTANAGVAAGQQERSRSVVRASPEGQKLRGVGGRPVEPATLYAHKGLNLVTGDVGWVIATSPSEAAKLAAERYGYSYLASALRGGKAGEHYLELDFGWFAFIDSYEESAEYPGNLSRDGAVRIWAYAARSREEAIRTAIGEYERRRGNSMAQLVYSGLVANFDRKGWDHRACSICEPHMLYRRFCHIGGRPGPRDADYTNRDPRLVPAQFEGALCESNERIPFMRAQEETVAPVLK